MTTNVHTMHTYHKREFYGECKKNFEIPTPSQTYKKGGVSVPGQVLKCPGGGRTTGMVGVCGGVCGVCVCVCVCVQGVGCTPHGEEGV